MPTALSPADASYSGAEPRPGLPARGRPGAGLQGRLGRLRGRDHRAPAGLVAAAFAVAALSLVPLGYILVQTVATGWDQAYALVVRPRVGELLRHTAALVAITVTASVLLGVAAAWLVERTDLPLRRLWAVLFAVPLAIPAFVTSYGWVSLYPSIEGLRGASLITTFAYFPFVYLPVAAVLRRLDPALEESARSLGHSPVGVLVRVVLPQLRTAVLGGALLVGLHLLAEYGALQMIRYSTFTTAIMEQYQSTFNGAAATMLAAVLVSLCLLLITVDVLLRGRSRYARFGSGAARPAPRVRLGKVTPLALLAAAAVCGIAIGVPFVSVGRWLKLGGAGLWTAPELLPALLSTLTLGLYAAAVTTAIALPVAWLAVRHRGWGSTLMERCTYLASAMPGIVVALAFVTVAIRYARPIYQSTLLIVVAYALLFLPRAMVSLRAGIEQAPPELEEAAKALGSSPLRLFGRVTLPLIAPAIAAGAALVFMAVVTELTATLLLAPTGTRTLATQFWSFSSTIDYAAAAPYALLMIVLSIPVSWFLLVQSHRLAGR
ncbi:MAG: iron(III) transport system permease protein [Pseudonocardiales bacterium]|jgi:iron(III) transport system permease protein|nr:iron(III) transport system permease protein [Pseudonocardiales bacterium]